MNNLLKNHLRETALAEFCREAGLPRPSGFETTFEKGFDVAWALRLQWIPVTEALPENAGFVWVTIEHGDKEWRITKEGYYAEREGCWYAHSGFATTGFIRESNVTAWLEIPRCPAPYYNPNDVETCSICGELMPSGNHPLCVAITEI